MAELRQDEADRTAKEADEEKIEEPPASGDADFIDELARRREREVTSR